MVIQANAVQQLLERERELETVNDAVRRAAEGAGGVLLIEGPAGVGKSRLLASARSCARSLRMSVLEARGAVLEREFAFGVARQLFEQTVAPGAAERSNELFAGAAGLATALLGDGHADLAAERGDVSFGALHGLYWLTANLADRGSLLLSVDDAHWSDRASLSFLSYLSRRLDGLPVLLVAVGRSPDPEGEELWRQLAEDPVAEVIRPQPLSELAAAEMVRARLGAAAEEEFCRACHRATGGNPLFLRELVAALAGSGISPTADAATAVTEVGPAAVSRFVLHRLERLGPPAVALARAVAVLGGDTEIQLAAQVAGLDPAQAREVADLLVQAELLAADQRLGFVHPVVQAAIYEDLLPGERAARHLAVAQLLDRDGAAAERVATHLLRCEPAADPRWEAVLRAAAADASERGDPRAAVAYLRRALEEPPEEGVRGEVLCDLGRWEIAIGAYDTARTHLLAALDSPAAAATRVRAAVWLSRSAIAFGTSSDATVALDAVLGELERAEGDLALELDEEALTLTQLEAPLRHQVDARLAEFARRAAGHSRFEPVARIHTACERMLRGEDAAAVAAEIEACLAAGPPGSVYAIGMSIDVLVNTERYNVAGRLLDTAIELARSLGLGTELASLHSQRALLAFMRGALGDADLDARTALDLVGDRHVGLPRAVSVAMQVAMERGRLGEAAELAERYRGNLARTRPYLDEFLTSRGRLRRLEGEPREALTDLIRCGELLETHGLSRPAGWRLEAAWALSELGEAERAEALASEAVQVARRFGADRALAQALRTAGTVIGGKAGLAMLEEAAVAVEHSPARLEAAYALAELGAGLVKQRRRREAREALRLAIEIALKCGAGALVDRIRGDLGAGGGRPPRLELKGLESLTPAERRVCDLAALDLTNREVAQRLFVTEKTVELHLTSAYRKLGLRSRFQLASVIPAPATPD